MKALIARHRATAQEFLRFGVIGLLGFFVDLGAFHLGLDVCGFGHYGSAFFAFPFAASFTWIGNRLFTFREGGRHLSVAAQWARFMSICTVGIVINRGTFSLLTATLPLVYAHPALGLIAGSVAGMFFNFALARRWVFGKGERAV